MIAQHANREGPIRPPEPLPSPRLAVLGVLALATGHDVENLILGAQACVRRLGRMDLVEDERRRYVDATIEALDQLGRMRANLLEVAPGGAGVVDPRALVDRTIERVRPVARDHGITLDSAVDRSAVTRCRDDGDLAFALTATVLELVRALAPGGHVGVEARARDDQLLFVMRGRQPADGPAIAAVDLDLAFTQALPSVGARLEIAVAEAEGVVVTLPVPLALSGAGSEDGRRGTP